MASKLENIWSLSTIGRFVVGPPTEDRKAEPASRSRVARVWNTQQKDQYMNSANTTDNYAIAVKDNAKAEEALLQGLRNQHAVEVQAIATIERQLGRYESYVDLHSRMQEDLTNSKAQAARLERLLSQHGTSASGIKETVTSVVGTVAGTVHITADDQVIKDVLAATGYKHYEIASYNALLAMAHAVGNTKCPPVLQESLAEEQDMAEWLQSHTPEVVTVYLHRYVNEA
jgi:ferritin-like metal-binding protein YciE